MNTRTLVGTVIAVIIVGVVASHHAIIPYITAAIGLTLYWMTVKGHVPRLGATFGWMLISFSILVAAPVETELVRFTPSYLLILLSIGSGLLLLLRSAGDSVVEEATNLIFYMGNLSAWIYAMVMGTHNDHACIIRITLMFSSTMLYFLTPGTNRRQQQKTCCQIIPFPENRVRHLRH